MTSEEFRQLLLEKSAGDIVSENITHASPGPFVPQKAIDFVADTARSMFQLSAEARISPIVVGSAKLGFSIIEKRVPGQTPKPRYRDYRPGRSDIDMAIVSPSLFGKIWSGLAYYGANRNPFPWRSEDLGIYMLHGWLRPDKFPDDGPQQILDWFKFMETLNRSPHFQYLRLRCGLYHSQYFLDIYQQRGVADAQRAERMA